MRRLTVLTAAALAAVSIGCTPAANTTVANKAMNSNSNVAVVVNSNSAAAANTGMTGNMTSNTTMMNSNLSRADFDKDKDRYSKEAKDAGRTVGSGINDSWLWTKTRAAMAATNDLRESTVNVDVSNDVVTLTGTVATAAQKTKAEEVAKGIDGVKSVTNSLKVQAGDSMTNQAVGTGNTMSNSNMKK